MNPHTLEVLEFDSIVEMLRGLCFSVPAKRIAIEPSDDVEEIEYSLDCLSEMVEIYEVDGGPPSLVFDDVDLMLEKNAAEGTVLEPTELLKVADLYDVTRGFLKIKHPNLKKLTEKLSYNEEIADSIGRTIQPPNEIKDGASTELKNIRRRIRLARAKIEEKFNSYIESEYSTFLSDNVVTMREGRYVLPVREGAKGKVKGVVHDRSSTGATFFIEPFEAVGLNNNLREMLSAEKQEIYRILRKLTDQILENIEAIKNNVAILSKLDIYSAKARFARLLNCQRPRINSDGFINIEKGYHPLLRWRDKQTGGDDTVPLDIELGRRFTTLVITGPNTGGKTVALKTIGLLCLMAQSGMFIPAGEGSTVPVFKDIFADIGDEQSLEASLSTFSAHLANIRNALEKAEADCLVLLDELGAGTDPDEGAVLGQAIIEDLTARKVPSIVTTHHGKLKALAVNLDGMENGSLEFDIRNLKPTYRFRLGVPGLSYGLETARKLGLDDKITSRAESLIDRSERKLSAIISQLSQSLQAAAENLEKARQQKLSYESLAKLYSEKLATLDKEKKRIKKEALKNVEQMFGEAKSKISALIEEAKKSHKKIEALRDVRRQTEEKIRQVREQVEKLEPRVSGPAASGEAGEKVYLPDLSASGEIIEKVDNSGNVRVRVGNVVLVTQLRRLFKLVEGEGGSSPSAGFTGYDKSAPDLQIDLRGLTYDEAQPLLDRYLDDVYMAGIEGVSVIHGKGTGALRSKIQNHLKNHPRVESFRLGNWDEGSYGVTVVKIKRD